MFTKRVYFVVVPLLLAAIAANVPRAWIYGQTPQERTSQVLSEFINLGSDPVESPIKADWLVRNERLKLLREKRLAHVPPTLIEAYAEADGITPAAFRARLIDPLRDDPFETATAPLQRPPNAPHGSVDGTSWAMVTSKPVPSGAGSETGCGLWLVFWDAQGWFYAPIGTKTWNETLRTALPKFRHVARGRRMCDQAD